MSFRVEVSRQAAREIGVKYDRMCEWASPTVANRWRDRILAAVQSLQEMPQRCAEAPEAA